MPYQHVLPILNSVPTIPWPLRKPMPSKVKHYLSVADILVKRFPSDMGGRAVEFLLDICQNQNPGPLVPLPWFRTADPLDTIQLGLPRVVDRLVPAMTFEARFG